MWLEDVETGKVVGTKTEVNGLCYYDKMTGKAVTKASATQDASSPPPPSP